MAYLIFKRRCMIFYDLSHKPDMQQLSYIYICGGANAWKVILHVDGVQLALFCALLTLAQQRALHYNDLWNISNSISQRRCGSDNHREWGAHDCQVSPSICYSIRHYSTIVFSHRNQLTREVDDLTTKLTNTEKYCYSIYIMSATLPSLFHCRGVQ